MAMQVTETSADGLKREFTVTVPSSDLDTAMNGRLQELGNNVTIPGFRPGKVPMALLKKRYGDAVKGEVLERTIQESWQQALTEKELRPASEPKVEIVTFEDGADLEYKLAVELMPEIDPIDFVSIKMEKLVVPISDEELESSLERIAENRKNFVAVSDGRAAAEGDQVVVDFVGTVDGEEFPGGAVNDFELEIGQGGFLPGFEEKIIGMKAGDRGEIKVDVPEDHPNDELKGKEVTFDVTVKEVREATAVAVDDELAKSVGMEDLDALKAAVREQMEREYGQLSRSVLKRDLLDHLADKISFELPEGIVDGEFETIWQQVMEAKEKDSLDADDKDKSEDELKERYRGIAERRVRLGLLLAEVGRTNNITVTQDDVNRAMHVEAAKFPGHEAAVLEYFQKNENAVQELQAPIFEEKVVDFIVEMATIEEKEVTPEELAKEAQDDGAGEAGENS